jgi:hypothetical protein
MALKTCGMLDYIMGTIEHLNFSVNPQGWHNWGSNDAFTRMQIQCNLTDAQMVHVNKCKTALGMWRSLEGMHDTKGHQALVVYMRNLYCLATEEGNNIVKHLNKMKEGREHINLMGDTRFYIPNITFKLLICQSLPQSWDNYTDAYIGSQTFTAEDPHTSISSQHFIGLLKKEYDCCKGRRPDTSPNANSQQVNFIKTSTRSLASRISSQPAGRRASAKQSSLFCKLCKGPGYPMDKCTRFEKHCQNCNHFGHEEATCHFEKITHKRKSGGNSSSGCGGRRKPYSWGKPPKNEETVHIEEVEEEVVFQSTKCDNEIAVDTEQYDMFNDTDVGVTYENGETLIYYDCLADSATTSHVSNCREAFITFEPTHKTLVGGVSGIKTCTKGQGTIKLESVHEGHRYSLTLKDVLYIPRNKNNLISLGCWKAAGGEYTGHNGKLMLTAKSGSHIA